MKEEKGYASPSEALAAGCREIRMPCSTAYQKDLEDGRIFCQIYDPADMTMGKPMVFPKRVRTGFHDDGC